MSILDPLELGAIIDARIAAVNRQLTRWGTVASRTDETNAMVTFDGSSQAIPVKILGDCGAIEGDRVALLMVGVRDWVVFGAMARHWLTDNGVSVDQSNGTCNVSSFADLPATTTFTFAKRWDATRIELYMAGRVYADAGPTDVEFGARFSSPSFTATDYAVASGRISNAFDYHTFTETVYVEDLPADTYTVTGRWRRFGGSGVLNLNSLTPVTITAKEVGP